MWETGVCGDSILSVSIGGINVGYLVVRGGVNCSFIINFIFLLFLDFYGVGGVGGKFDISQ